MFSGLKLKVKLPLTFIGIVFLAVGLVITVQSISVVNLLEDEAISKVREIAYR